MIKLVCIFATLLLLIKPNTAYAGGGNTVLEKIEPTNIVVDTNTDAGVKSLAKEYSINQDPESTRLFSPNLILNVSAFQIAILAFLIPLSFDMVSKISDKYNSDVISRFFSKRILPKWYQLMALLSIFLLVLIGAFPVSETLAIILTLTIFILNCIWVGWFLYKFRLYLESPIRVVQELVTDAKEALK